MYYLHKSYCYETLQDVADTIYSQVFLGNGDAINSASVQGTSIQIAASNQQGSYIVTTTPPSCETLGFNNSYFGVDPVTAAQLGFACGLAILSVWAVKIGKRAL